MKRFILKKVERVRLLAALLVTVCGFATANAQLESDDISEALLVEGSVPVRWTNDATHPWYIATDENGSYMRTPETEDDQSFTSTLSFSYSSSYPTEITYKWYNDGKESPNYGYDDQETYDAGLSIYIDGEYSGNIRRYSWGWENKKIMVPPGSHTIDLKSVSGDFYGSWNDRYYSAVSKFRVWECKELESACLKEGSLPLTFENDTDLEKMWITEDGYVRSPLSDSVKTTATFSIDKPSIFSYEVSVGRAISSYSSQYYNVVVYVDGHMYSQYQPYNNYQGYTYWESGSVALYPGTHTVEFVGVLNYEGYDPSIHYNTTCLRNIRLDQNWYEVTLNNPGELGTRLTQVLEGRPMQEMELLKIKGAMNSDDWDKIGLLTGIKAIDFTETSITGIPGNAFYDLSYLSTVILPETLKTIGSRAFVNTNIYQIEIPTSVESIGEEAWMDTPLRYITLSQDSKLNYIGGRAFSGTNIIEFYMPDSVTELGTYKYYTSSFNYRPVSHLFYNCSSLTKLHISDNIDRLEEGFAYGCSSLTEVNIPANTKFIGSSAFYRTDIKSITIPESVTSIGDYAFSSSSLESVTIPKNVVTLGEGAFDSCEKLKTVELNSHCWEMSYTFSNCTALERVVLPCATPPTIRLSGYDYAQDPFSGVTKSNVTLVVPDFAFDTYRSHSYWYGFTNTVKGDEASINDYWAIRGTLNLNNDLTMQGNPSVEIMTNGKLTFDANSTQTFNEFTYNTSESAPAVVLSQSNTVKADRLVSKFDVARADTWYFFSPVTDVNMAEVTYPATDSWVIRYYDGARRASEDATSGNWVNVPADGTLRAGQGYIIQARDAGWLYLPAASAAQNDKFFGANAVTFQLEDNACETEANAGWNFVANPYPTYYDIYYIDMQAPITVWDGSTYRAYSLNDGDRGDDTFVLRPMQPFFVQKSEAGLATGMPLVGRQVNTTIDRSRAPRPVIVDENRHKLNLELFCNDNEAADDYTRVVINEAAALAYETVRDASKFMSMNAEVAQLYTLGADGHPMAINERPYEDGNVALGVLLPAADRTYRIAARRADRKAWLYDAETGIEQDLTEGDYIFSASKTGVDNKRFSIRFAPAGTTAAEGIEAVAVKVTGNVGSISVIAPADAAVAVYGTDGSIITDTTATDGQLEIEVAGGIYVVKVNGESFKTIVK